MYLQFDGFTIANVPCQI